MSIKNSSILKAFVVIIFLGPICQAQESDENFDALMNETTNNTEPMQKMDESGQSVALLNDDPKRDDHSFYGFSFGVAMSAINLNLGIETYDPRPVPTTPPFTKESETDAFLNFGVVGRYSILPVDRIGTDINVGYYTSMNHESISLDPNDSSKTAARLSVFKAELNLGYTIGLSKGMKIYFLGGAGAQYMIESPIKNLLRFGGGAQVGGGINIQNFNVELMYSYYRNRFENSINTNIDSLAYRVDKMFVDSKGFVGRASYNF
jgi:hypothetical protein